MTALGRRASEVRDFLNRAIKTPADGGLAIHLCPLRQPLLFLSPPAGNGTTAEIMAELVSQLIMVIFSAFTQIDNNARTERSRDVLTAMKGKGLLGRKPRPARTHNRTLQFGG